MPVPGVILLLAVAIIVGALVYYLVATIVALRRVTSGLDRTLEGVKGIVEKSAPVNGVVTTINGHLDTAVMALEALLVKKAGLVDAVAIVDGLYPGAAAAGFRDSAESTYVKPVRIGEVYTPGVLQLARLGREAPIATASPDGPVLRDTKRSSAASYPLYPDIRHTRPEQLPRSPVIGTNSPVRYEPSESPGVRKRLPVRNAGLDHDGRTDANPSAV